MPGEATTVKPLRARVVEVCLRALALGNFQERACSFGKRKPVSHNSHEGLFGKKQKGCLGA